MEFRIQRYQGNEEEQGISSDKQSNLFQARIEERRRKRKEQLQKSGNTEQSNDEKENVKKKKKKKMKDADPDGVPGKKKKKKYKLDVSNSEADNVSDKELNTHVDIVDLSENVKVCNNTITENDDSDINHAKESSMLKNASPRKKVKHKLLNSEQNGNLLDNEIKNNSSNNPQNITGSDNYIKEENGEDDDDEGDHNINDTGLTKKDNCNTKVKNKKSNLLKASDIPEIAEGDLGEETQVHCKITGTSLDVGELGNKGELEREEHNSDKDVSKNSEQNTAVDVSENDKVNNENHVQSTEKYFPILGKHNKVKKAIVKRTLPRWLNEPVLMSADINSCKVCIKSIDFLSETLINNLTLNGIEYLFPVQSSVIHKVITQNIRIISKFPPHDMCVQAPTGSGKTLAYVLPIIDVLSKYIVRQLYCLVVVPSKDLAVQVYKVFDTYITGTNLKVALASGLKTFSKEQGKLVTKGDVGCCSKVDIVVCTPGRLVDHLKQTPGFNLKHLRFLVVDEADRLLGQDYSSWLDEVKMSVHSPDDYLLKRRKMFPINASTFLGCQMPFQKLLFSATLTQNPEKIAPLELFHPILFTSKLDLSKLDQENGTQISIGGADGDRFIIPENLEEKMVVVEVDQKPLVLVFLMLSMKWKGVLCFTKSIEATHRLCLLLQSFQGFTVAEFSSSLSEMQRKGIIRDFNSGKVDLLISSDAMARGMDIDTVKLVVNYDTAVNDKTYVHRVGRTARAGKKGCAMTILCSKEVYHFKLMMKKLSGKAIPKMSIPKKTLDSYQEEYEVALSSLQDRISLEHRNINAGNFVKRT